MSCSELPVAEMIIKTVSIEDINKVERRHRLCIHRMIKVRNKTLMSFLSNGNIDRQQESKPGENDTHFINVILIQKSM